MQLFEKIFQRNDKFYLLIYYLILGLSITVSAFFSYYLRNKTFNLPELYLTGSTLLTLIFWILSIGRSSQDRHLQGASQWFKIEFTALVQTFLFGVLLASVFKTTDDYSRIWFFSSFILSIIVFIVIKIFFDCFYKLLVKSNIIQRNILLIGDSESCQNIIKKLPKDVSNSVIKCLIITNQNDSVNSIFYRVPIFSM